MDELKLSIITVVLNDQAGFLKTAQSVFEQRKTYKNMEFIVIDGGSIDGTQDLLLEFSEKIDYCVSEPDAGIYAAMNKGIRLANGDALLFLNAGDYFVGDVLSNFDVAPAFIRVKYVDVLGHFRVRMIENEKIGISNCHQGIIFQNKNIYYDESISICADYKYFLDHGLCSKVNILNSDGFIFFDAVGVSSKKVKERDRQIFVIRREYFGFFVAVLFEAWPFTKRLIRFCIGK